MKLLLEQLDSIKAIVDTVSSSQIAQNPEDVASSYELYAVMYNPAEQVKLLSERLCSEIKKGKPVNGYLSAGFGYGKTATLVYLWHFCQLKNIIAVPPFKFKELGDLIVASYNWIKYVLRLQPEIIPQIDILYEKYSLLSQKNKALEIAQKYKISEEKILKIVQDLKTDTINTDSVLNFWQESIPIIRSAGFAGLAVFADESQEFLRTEEGSSARIQTLSDLVKGMRALGNTPVALILSMPIDPTESAIEEQAGDIIHRMKEQRVSLRLADVYNNEFPIQLWNFLCQKFLKSKLHYNTIVHPSTIESLGQLCDRKDLCNAPRAVIEIFKRLVHFVKDNNRPYTPLDLVQDYLTGMIKLYGTEQHRINNTISILEQLNTVKNHPQGREVIKLLAIFPNGVASSVAKEFGLLKCLQKLTEDGNLYGLHITQPSSDSFALVSLSEKQTSLTVLDEILNNFRQRWFRDWDNLGKLTKANNIFRSEILPLLFPPSRPGQKANWTWRYKDWKQERYSFYNILSGAPERYNILFPKRTLTVSVSSQADDLMRFKPLEESHLDWRFYLSYDQIATNALQNITAIAGTGQIDFNLQLGRSFEDKYPTAFGLLRKVMAPEQCSACTLLNLSDYIKDWLNNHPDVSKTDLARLEQHRRECHQYALQILFPVIKAETWLIQGLKNLVGTETRLIESIFYQACQVTFPNYKSFYYNIGSTLRKYKLALGKVSLEIRRGRKLHQVPKDEFEKLFETGGSSLSSFLSSLKQSLLISDYKIASKQNEKSQVQFTEHYLELLIQRFLSEKGKSLIIDREHRKSNIKGLSYQELWEEVKKYGYLREEFEESIECLELRRYVERDRQTNFIHQAVAELDSDELKSQINELKKQVSKLLRVFDDNILKELQQKIEDAYHLVNTQRYDEVILDKLHRTIQSCIEINEGFCCAKRSALQQDLHNIKNQLKQFNLELQFAQLHHEIIGDSGLEACLNEYRRILEKQILQTDKACKKLSDSIKEKEIDILTLHKQREQFNKSLETYVTAKTRLLPLVTSLEQWQVIVLRASNIKQIINNDFNSRKRYEDNFVDRVVTYFSIHGIDSFKHYDQLKAPLDQIEQDINSEKQVHREKFDQLLNRCDELLGQICSGETQLKDFCKFDNDDREGSYKTLRLVLCEQLQKKCNQKILEWQILEENLLFLAQEREQNVNECINIMKDLKQELLLQLDYLSINNNDFQKLEELIVELKSLFQKGRIVHDKFIQFRLDKKQNLKDEEKQILNTVCQIGGSAVSISQIRQHTSQNQNLWEILKNLYKTGHLDIVLRQRDVS